MLRKVIFCVVASAICASLVWYVLAVTPKDSEGDFRHALTGAETSDERMSLYDAYLNRVKPARMLEILDEPKESEMLCHNEGHELGRLIFRHSRNLNEAIGVCRGHCTNGCFHGVLMEAFQGAMPKAGLHINGDEIKQNARALCSSGAGGYSPADCYHGIGHALLFIDNNDIASALESCGALAEQPSEEYYCEAGVFMERDIVLGEDDMRDEALNFPCDTYTKFPATCYRYKMWRISSKLNNDINSIVQVCLSLAGAERLGCFSGFGVLKAGEVVEKPESINEFCGRGDLLDQRMCIESAVEYISTYFNKEIARTVCSLVASGEKSNCIAAAEGGVARWDRDFSLYRNTSTK